MPRPSLSSGERKLRYRELISEVADIDEENGVNTETLTCVSKLVAESDRLLAAGDEQDHAKNPAEGFLDSQLLRATSNIVVRCSEAVSGNVNTYHADELAQHIRNNPDFWDFSLPRTVPVFAYLHGTFDPTPPEHRPKVRRKHVEKQKLGELKEPEAVDKLEKTEEGAEMMSRVNRFITKKYRDGAGRPLSYFHLVIDPTSFSKTVENAYYISFLVRDGLISIDIDDATSLPGVKPLSAAQKDADERAGLEENQFIVSLDMQLWREYVQALKIKEPMMVIKRG